MTTVPLFIFHHVCCPLVLLKEWTHCIQLGVDVAGVISAQNQNSGWHVARVLTGHQDGKLSIQANTHTHTCAQAL